MEALEGSVSYGFGPERMKQMKVCPKCKCVASSRMHTCPECGGRLPQSNLFQLYQKHHHLCPICDTVLSDSMKFCPHCGTRIQPQTLLNKKGRN